MKKEEEKYGSLDDVEIGTIKDVVETKRSEDFCSTYSRFIIQAILSASIITFSFVVILKQPEKDNSATKATDPTSEGGNAASAASASS